MRSWRGFGPLGASIAVGIIWAVWHLPLFFMSSMPQYGSPFVAYVLYTISLSIALTFLAAHTAGSVLIATLFHGAVNTFIVANEGASPLLRGWGNATAYGIAALSIVLIGRLKPPDSSMQRTVLRARR